MNNRNRIEIEKIQQVPESSQGFSKPPLICGWDYAGLPTIDPVDSWDRASHAVFLQCLEPLVSYDLSNHPYYTLKPMLAESWIWENSTRISFKIRENVKFHDGTLLDANAVKWNFERIMYFCDPTGTLVYNSTSWEAFPSELFYLANGTFIFDSFEVPSTYNFTINLNIPFGPLIDLLTFPATYILSPASTPRYSYLDRNSDVVIGTGPFVYDSYEFYDKVRFHAYENYWGGKADIEELIFKSITDSTSRMNAGLAGEIHYVDNIPDTYIDTFRATESIHVEDVGEELVYRYLEFYCGPQDYDGSMIIPGDHQYQRINSTLRRALALAINYTSIIEEMLRGSGNYGVPAIPRAMPGHNGYVRQAYGHTSLWWYNDFATNVKQARVLMQNMGYGIGLNTSYPGPDDTLWAAGDFITLEVNEHFGWGFNIDLNMLLTNNWDLIGIDVDVIIREYGAFLDTAENTPWEMDIWYNGWIADYLNPYCMIDPLFNLDSPRYYCRLNDTNIWGLTDKMKAAIAETDYSNQLDLWRQIQYYIYDVVDPLTPASHAQLPIYTRFLQSVHHEDLTNFPYNVLNWLYFYPCKWNRSYPGSILLTSDAGNPDTDGKFNLIWTVSTDADNYSLYTSTSNITEITLLLTILARENAESPFSISGLSNGEYYYIVKSFNEFGTILSNCLKVKVNISKIPGYHIVLFIIVIGVTSTIVVINRGKKLRVNSYEKS